MKAGIYGRSNLLKRFLISYIAILIIPTIIASLVIRETAMMIKKDALEANLNLIEQTQHYIEQDFNEINSFSIRIAMDDSLSWLMNNKNPIQKTDIYALRENIHRLQSYSLSKDLVSDYYLIYPNSGIVLTQNSLYNLKDFYGNIYKKDNMEYDDWVKSFLNTRHSMSILPATTALVEGDKESVITYLESIPLEPTLPQLGTIMVLVKEDEIMKSLTGINTEGGGNVYIINSSGEIIASKDKANHIEIPEDILKDKTNGYSERIIDGKKMLISYTNSNLYGWTFVAVTQSDVVLSRMNYIWKLIFIAFISCLLLGLVAAYFLAYKNAKPIREIIRMIKSHTDIMSMESSDEYNYLHCTFSNLLERDGALMEKLQKHIPLLQAEFIKRLIKGEFGSQDEMNSYMLQAELDIQGECFNVFLIQFRGYYGELSLETLKELNILKIILKNTFTELKKDEVQAYPMDVDEATVAYVLSYCKKDNSKSTLSGLVSQVRDRMNQEYSVLFSAAAGNFCNNLLDVYYSFSQAKHVFDNKKNWNEENIEWFEEINSEDKWFYYYPVDLELRLMNLIKVGNREEVCKLLDIIYSENFLKNRISRDMANNLFNELRGSIMKITEQISEMNGDYFYTINTGLKKLKHCDKIDDATSMIKEICLYMCDIINDRKKGRSSKLKEEIISFVKDNYMKQELSLSYVAIKVELSETNLSHIFKDQIGENFSEYVERLRIDKACELILNSNKSIEKIAEETGYSSAYSFRRAFKRCKGVIPSDFRKVSNSL